MNQVGLLLFLFISGIPTVSEALARSSRAGAPAAKWRDESGSPRVGSTRGVFRPVVILPETFLSGCPMCRFCTWGF